MLPCPHNPFHGWFNLRKPWTSWKNTGSFPERPLAIFLFIHLNHKCKQKHQTTEKGNNSAVRWNTWNTLKNTNALSIAKCPRSERLKTQTLFPNCSAKWSDLNERKDILFVRFPFSCLFGNQVKAFHVLHCSCTRPANTKQQAHVLNFTDYKEKIRNFILDWFTSLEKRTNGQNLASNKQHDHQSPKQIHDTQICTMWISEYNWPYQRHKQMIEDKINGHQRGHLFSCFPHGGVHHFIPAFLRQDLKHRHRGLRVGKLTEEKSRIRKQHNSAQQRVWCEDVWMVTPLQCLFACKFRKPRLLLTWKRLGLS